jgi:hypothetical protein
VVLRFGRHVRTWGQGRTSLPFGIEQVYRVETEKQHKVEFGSAPSGGPALDLRKGYGAESSMLTGT